MDARKPRPVWLVVGSIVLGVSVSMAFAQWPDFGFRRSRYPPRYRPPGHHDNGFTFCRLMYTSVRSEPSGSGWSTDYPYADINFMIRLSELTTTHVNMDDEGEPIHWTVPITDDALFGCPFVMTSDIGTVGLSPEEVVRLREYLLKGGFLWVDDFWGERAWGQWASEIAQVLPPAVYPIADLPLDHELFTHLFYVWEIPQITNIGFWRRVGGATTSERGSETSEPHFRVIRDEHGRIMVVITHNTDIADSWEREGEDPDFFKTFSPDGYAVGVNVALHTMTH